MAPSFFIMKESLEHHILEELEPEHWYETNGLYIWGKRRAVKKNEIDVALKKLWGKNSHKPAWKHKKDFTFSISDKH